jgi:lipopolysaccharide transport system permease protein/teichoic acid transport system permease protein
MPKASGIFKTLYSNRLLIWRLALFDLRSRYAATFAGALWAVINPVALILVFWFVSAYGLKVSWTGGPPLHLLLFCALVPWITFSEALPAGSGAVLSHQYLVKKIAFPLEILPLVHIVSSTIIHFALLALLLVILISSGHVPGWNSFGILYYLVAMLAFVTGLSWVLAPLNVFNRDVGQALAPILTIWFWVTPIVWPASNMPEWARGFVAYNPLYFIVEGYRSALLFDQPIGHLWPLDLQFWGVTLLLLVVGARVFERLKPHFADIL